MELSIIVMWCMTSASQWKFPATQLALYTTSLWLVVNWLKLERTGLIEFKFTWYKRESCSLALTSALDFNKEGCVIQIRAD